MSKHTHQYRRTDIGVNKEYIVFRCVVPDCGHYLVPSLVEGRECVCSRCNSKFIMEKKHLALAQPHCDNCTVKKETVSA